MFGGLAFMVGERLAVSVGRQGDLLVRVDPDDYDRWLERGATPATMKDGERPMGRRWLSVPSQRLKDDDELAFWVNTGIAAGR